MKRESYSWVIQNLPKLVFTVTCFSRKKNTACNTKVFLASYHPSVALATWFSSIVTLPWETFGLKKKTRYQYLFPIQALKGYYFLLFTNQSCTSNPQILGSKSTVACCVCTGVPIYSLQK